MAQTKTNRKPLLFYGFVVVAYAIISLVRDAENVFLHAVNAVLLLWLGTFFCLQYFLNLKKNPKLSELSRTGTYLLCSGHVGILSLLLTSSSPAFPISLSFLPLFRIGLPMSIGVFCEIPLHWVLFCQIYMCSATSFLAHPLSGNKTDVLLYLLLEFAFIIICFNQLVKLHDFVGPKKIQEDVESEVELQKASYIAQVAHDIGTPLTTFSLTVEALMSEKLTEDQLEMVYTLESAVDLMTVVRLEALDMERHVHGLEPVPSLQTVSLSKLVVKCERVMRNYAGAGDVSINFFVAPSAADVVELDHNWIWSMLVNLLSNAKKFTFKGPIIVSVFTVTKEGNAKSSSPVETVLRFEVADKGVGVPLNKQKKLFHAFTQLHEAQRTGGTGIGLHSVYIKSKILGGHAGMRSNHVEGKGSIFYIEVPYNPIGTTQYTGKGMLKIFGDYLNVVSAAFMERIALEFEVVTTKEMRHYHTNLSVLNKRKHDVDMVFLSNNESPQVLRKKKGEVGPFHKMCTYSGSMTTMTPFLSPKSKSAQGQHAESLLNSFHHQLESLPIHQGSSLAILVYKIEDENILCTEEKSLKEIRSLAQIKNYTLVYGGESDIYFNLIGVVIRNALQKDEREEMSDRENAQGTKRASNSSPSTDRSGLWIKSGRSLCSGRQSLRQKTGSGCNGTPRWANAVSSTLSTKKGPINDFNTANYVSTDGMTDLLYSSLPSFSDMERSRRHQTLSGSFQSTRATSSNGVTGRFNYTLSPALPGYLSYSNNEDDSTEDFQLHGGCNQTYSRVYQPAWATTGPAVCDSLHPTSPSRPAPGSKPSLYLEEDDEESKSTSPNCDVRTNRVEQSSWKINYSYSSDGENGHEETKGFGDFDNKSEFGEEFQDSGNCDDFNILVIADDKSMLKLLSYMFMKIGYRVYLAFSWKEGVRLAEERNYKSILVTDEMAHSSHYEVISRIRQLETQNNIGAQCIIILMLDGKGALMDQDHAAKVGPTAFVPMPCQFSEIIALIERENADTRKSRKKSININFQTLDDDHLQQLYSETFQTSKNSSPIQVEESIDDHRLSSENSNGKKLLVDADPRKVQEAFPRSFQKDVQGMHRLSTEDSKDEISSLNDDANTVQRILSMSSGSDMQDGVSLTSLNADTQYEQRRSNASLKEENFLQSSGPNRNTGRPSRSPHLDMQENQKRSIENSSAQRITPLAHLIPMTMPQDFKRQSAKSELKGTLHTMPKIGKNILVVDDDKSISKYLSRMLRNQGWSVEVGSNGQQGLDLLKAQHFNAALIDRNMPVLDGLQCIQRFRTWESDQLKNGVRCSPQYIIMMTANASVEDRNQILGKTDINNFVAKPFKMKDILEAINNASAYCNSV